MEKDIDSIVKAALFQEVKELKYLFQMSVNEKDNEFYSYVK